VSSYKLFALVAILAAPLFAAALPQTVEIEVTPQAEASARRDFILDRAIEFTARQAIAEGKDDYGVRNFVRNIKLSDLWNGIGHVGVVLTHGSCENVPQLVSETLNTVESWKQAGEKLVAGAKCLKDATVDCEMSWKQLGPDHHQLTLEKCSGASASAFTGPVVVETVPLSDTRLQITRLK